MSNPTNYSTAVMLFNPNIRAIKVSYETKEENKNRAFYTYKTLDETIQVGDYVVVPTDTRHGMTVCKVEEVDIEIDFEDNTQIKWLVDRVASESYEKILEDEKVWIDQMKAAQKRKQREELKKSMMEMYQDEGLEKASIVNMGGVPAIEAVTARNEEETE